MTQRIVLHVGAPKTGTTYLQEVLFQGRPQLRANGVLVPGANKRQHNFGAAGLRQGSQGNRYRAWRRLREEIASWSGSVLISYEWLSMISAERAATVAAELGELGEVHVVATARDVVDQVPAAWQEALKVGLAAPIDDFADQLDHGVDRWSWDVLDVAEFLGRWDGAVPADRLHVVTLPPRGTAPEELWRRFAEATGLEPEWCSTTVDFARESLGVETARLLQLAGPMLREAIDAENSGWQAPYRWIQRYLAHGMLLKHRGGRITMGEEGLAIARERSLRSIDRISRAGYVVHGDLADLTSSRLPDGAVHPDSVPDSDVLPIALQLIADLLAEARQSATKTADSS